MAWTAVRGRAPGYAFSRRRVLRVLCSWIWYFGAIAIVPFVSRSPAYWAARRARSIGWLRARAVSRTRGSTAAVWVCADAVVARLPFGGFSWGEVGYAFHDLAPARAVASVGGVTFVTFLVVALNALLADLVGERRLARQLRPCRRGIARASPSVVVGATVTHADPPVIGHVRVALVQGNDKNRDLTRGRGAMRGTCRRATSSSPDRSTDPGRPDRVPGVEHGRRPDGTDPYRHESNLVEVARQARTRGCSPTRCVDADPTGAKLSNLNVLFEPDGRSQGTYTKRHLVPFGESVPFRRRSEHVVSELTRSRATSTRPRARAVRRRRAPGSAH